MVQVHQVSKEVQRLYKGAKEVQMQRKCRGGKEQVQRC